MESRSSCRKNDSFTSTSFLKKLRSPQMAILSSLRAARPTLSFEFFPPKSEKGSQELLETVHELGKLDPAFVSVTYGAGGTTRERTREVVRKIISDTCVPTIPHLTCIGHSASAAPQPQELRPRLHQNVVGPPPIRPPGQLSSQPLRP